MTDNKKHDDIQDDNQDYDMLGEDHLQNNENSLPEHHKGYYQQNYGNDYKNDDFEDNDDENKVLSQENNDLYYYSDVVKQQEDGYVPQDKEKTESNEKGNLDQQDQNQHGATGMSGQGEALYIMNLELDNKNVELKIFENSVPLKLAYEFCIKHNLEFDSMDYLSKEIEGLLYEYKSKMSNSSGTKDFKKQEDDDNIQINEEEYSLQNTGNIQTPDSQRIVYEKEISQKLVENFPEDYQYKNTISKRSNFDIIYEEDKEDMLGKGDTRDREFSGNEKDYECFKKFELIENEEQSKKNNNNLIEKDYNDENVEKDEKIFLKKENKESLRYSSNSIKMSKDKSGSNITSNSHIKNSSRESLEENSPPQTFRRSQSSLKQQENISNNNKNNNNDNNNYSNNNNYNFDLENVLNNNGTSCDEIAEKIIQDHYEKNRKPDTPPKQEKQKLFPYQIKSNTKSCSINASLYTNPTLRTASQNSQRQIKSVNINKYDPSISFSKSQEKRDKEKELFAKNKRGWDKDVFTYLYEDSKNKQLKKLLNENMNVQIINNNYNFNIQNFKENFPMTKITQRSVQTGEDLYSRGKKNQERISRKVHSLRSLETERQHKECRFSPNIIRSPPKYINNVSSSNLQNLDFKDFERTRKIKIEQIQKNIVNDDIENTFRPDINPKSKDTKPLVYNIQLSHVKKMKSEVKIQKQKEINEYFKPKVFSSKTEKILQKSKNFSLSKSSSDKDFSLRNQKSIQNSISINQDNRGSVSTQRENQQNQELQNMYNEYHNYYEGVSDDNENNENIFIKDNVQQHNASVNMQNNERSQKHYVSPSFDYRQEKYKSLHNQKIEQLKQLMESKEKNKTKSIILIQNKNSQRFQKSLTHREAQNERDYDPSHEDSKLGLFDYQKKENIFEKNYKYALVYKQNKDIKDNIHKDDLLRNSNLRNTDSYSQRIFNEKRDSLFRKLFSVLDYDHDNLITRRSVGVNLLSRRLQQLISPLVKELISEDETLNSDEFVQAMGHLSNTLSYIDKNELLKEINNISSDNKTSSLFWKNNISRSHTNLMDKKQNLSIKQTKNIISSSQKLSLNNNFSFKPKINEKSRKLDSQRSYLTNSMNINFLGLRNAHNEEVYSIDK